MATCVNRSAPEFIKLLQETNLKPDILGKLLRGELQNFLAKIRF